MRRIWSVCLTLGLAAMLCTQALAAGKVEIVRAFVHDGTLCTYLSMEGMERPVTRAEAKIGAQSFPASDRLETVRQAGAPVTWLLLVDNSTSMPAFRRQAADFAESLARSGGERTKFILATFGDAFAVAEKDVPAGELAAALETIPMDERVTRLHTAIAAALDYFEDLPRERSELRCMAVLSDAVQYDPAGGVPYEELLERVGRSDVMLYSVGFGDDAEALERLGRLAAASGGLHQALGEDLGAAEAGETLAARCGELFVTGFDLSGCEAPPGKTEVSVTFAAGGELVCRAETQVELPPLTGETGSAPQASVQLPDTSDPPPAGGAAASAAPAPEKEGPPIALIVGIAAAVLAVVAEAVLLRKKKPVPAPALPVAPEVPAAPAQTVGIYMRLELVRGALADARDQMELDLRDELTIGTDPACDIVLRDGGADRHARLFSRESAVYIEDLRTSDGTKVNGVKIQDAQRLRSGDGITIGDVTIRLKF